MRVVTIKVICNGIIGDVTMKTKSQEKNPPPSPPPQKKKFYNMRILYNCEVHDYKGNNAYIVCIIKK